MNTIQTPRPLTDRQARILQYLGDYIAQHGYPPTQREIMRRFRMKSTQGVARHFDALEKKGHLSRTPRGARALELTGRSAERGIPIVGKVAAGLPILAVENLEGALALDGRVAPWNDTFFLRVKGDSMIEAGIAEGDLLLVKPQETADNGDIVVALLNSEATVKRVVKHADRVVLHAANPAYPPIEVTKGSGEFRIIGKAMALFRSLSGSLMP